MYQDVQTCILEVSSTRIRINLAVDNVYSVRSSLPHAARYIWNRHCSNVTRDTQIRESTRGYIRDVLYLPTLAVAVLAKIYLLSPFLRDMTPLNKFTTSFGLSAGPMFKWRGCRMRIRNQNKISGWNTLHFYTLEY